MNSNYDCCRPSSIILAESEIESNYSCKTIVKKKSQQDPSLSERYIKMELFRWKFCFFTIPPNEHDIYSNPEPSFGKNSTPAEFDQSMLGMESYDSNKYNRHLDTLCHHALMNATRDENIPLIKHICELRKSGHLFLVGSQDKTPLHIATASIAKELLKLGFPVNITKNNCLINGNHKTPLDCAIQSDDMQKATLLIRNGGISICPYTDIRKLNEAVMTKNERVFKLHFIDSETQAKMVDIPSDILNLILLFCFKLDRVEKNL